MLTSFDFLQPGKPFPPVEERARMSRYLENDLLFQGLHAKVWAGQYHNLANALRKSNRDVDTVLNYQQLLSKKTADFVCGTPPTLETEGDTDGILALLRRQNFFAKLYEAMIDVSRFGDAVLKFVDKRVSICSPINWYPVVDPTDLKAITHHVIAYPCMPDPQGKMTQLYVEIHTPGQIETKRFKLDGITGTIGPEEVGAETATTGLTDFAVQVLSNVTHSGSIYGLDDYEIVNSLVRKVLWRLHCADTVLDKHSEPSMTGPDSAVEWDEKMQTYYVNLGKYIRLQRKEDPELKYLTWDGNLESSFKEIDLLLNQLYTLSEMGQAFMEGSGGGEASSGTALKLRMVSPRIKAARIVGINELTVKQIISMLCQINAIAMDPEGITLRWNDGLPEDPVEQTAMLVAATGGKAIMSQYAALKARGLSDQEVEDELDQMQEESAVAQPVNLGVMDQAVNEDGQEEAV